MSPALSSDMPLYSYSRSLAIINMPIRLCSLRGDSRHLHLPLLASLHLCYFYAQESLSPTSRPPPTPSYRLLGLVVYAFATQPFSASAPRALPSVRPQLAHPLIDSRKIPARHISALRDPPSVNTSTPRRPHTPARPHHSQFPCPPHTAHSRRAQVAMPRARSDVTETALPVPVFDPLRPSTPQNL